jgi:CHAT domain-containing protein
MAWTARSEVEELRGRHAEAVRAAAEGSRAARERLVANVRALSDRQALLLANNTSDPLDQLLRVGARTDPASIHRCWDELTRTRGLVRAEIMRRRLPPGSERDAVLASASAGWRLAERRLAQWEGHMAGSVRDPQSDSTLRVLRADVDETERQLARVLPTSTGLGEPGLVGIDSVLAHLTADQALVGLVTVPQPTGRHLLAFVARGDGSAPSGLDLGDLVRIDVAVAHWRAELGEPDPALRSESACRRTGAVLRALVWDSIARSTRGTRDVFLVPEASLIGIPWGALPIAGGGYLVESGLRIHVLDAERELAAPNEQPAGRGLLAVGGVDFDRATTETPPSGEYVATNLRGAMTSCGSPLPARLASLPGTAEEIRDVTLAWSAGAAASGPVTSLAREAATEAAFKRLAPGHRVVHLATHGIVLSDTCEHALVGARGVGGVAPVSASSAKHSHGTTPRDTRVIDAATQPTAQTPPVLSPWSARETILAFADANHANAHTADENEGLLTAEEVATLDLRGTDWVVLSACRSAAGEAWEREGVLGMQRAFHVAGARTVIASQWSVDDEATREWMRALYQARSRGASSATEAIAVASRSTLEARRRSHRTTHPFYWAAFTASGE